MTKQVFYGIGILTVSAAILCAYAVSKVSQSINADAIDAAVKATETWSSERWLPPEDEPVDEPLE